MASSCGIPNFGTEDKTLIRQVCQRVPQAAMQKIIGRAPVCPSACLRPIPAASRKADTMPTGGVRASPVATLRSFWSRGISRSPSQPERQ